MDMPLVSICLLTYMHERYIEDCLRGVLNQTYENMEIIILDDYSIDNTFTIIQNTKSLLSKKFVRVVIEQNKKNTGNISQNMNRMIRFAKGEYIKPITGDDIMKSCCIKRMVSCMEFHPDRLMCYANTYVIDERYRYGDKPGSECFYKNHKAYPQKEIFQQLMKLCYVSPSILVRSKMYEKYGNYDEMIYYEDYDMWLRIGREEEFLYIPQKLEYYRRSINSKTNYKTKGGESRFLWMLKEEQKVIKKHLLGVSDTEKKVYIDYFYDRFIWSAKNAGLWRLAIGLGIKKRCEGKKK